MEQYEVVLIARCGQGGNDVDDYDEYRDHYLIRPSACLPARQLGCLSVLHYR